MVKGYIENLSSALWQLQQSGTFCDTVLIVSGNVEMKAHAVVLAAASARLCSMLQQNRSDNYGQYQLDVIDYDISTVAALLEFIYTGKVIALQSMDGSSRNVTGLCVKLGITVDGISIDNSSAIELNKNITDGPVMESVNASQCNNMPSEFHSNDNERVDVTALNEVPNAVCLSDQAKCSDLPDMTCNFSSYADQSEAKLQVDPEAAGIQEAVDKNDSALQARSAKVKRAMQKQVRGRTRLARDQLLSCSNCNETFSPRDHLLKQDSDLAEKLNCPHCQRPCVQVAEPAVESQPSEADVKTGDSNPCSTVDASQLRPECTDASALDRKRQVQCGRTRAATRASNSLDSKGTRRLHRCSVCSRRCSTAAALKQHEQVHAKGSTRSTMASCRTCGKKFRNMSYLRCHERLHEGGERPFICDVCGKGFIGSSNLTTHRRTHTGERPYACSVCHKRFFQLCAVREHEKIHIGIKMFVCDVCGKQFMTHAQLYNHSRTHGGVKSFECEVCQKRFYTNGDLVKHARIHADRRPFVCDVCGKGFKYSSNLHGHSRIHTGTRPFPCQTCGKAFTYSSHLSRHVKMHTRNNVALEEATTSSTKDESATTTSSTTKDEPSSPPAITQSSLTDNTVNVGSNAPSAILFVKPELLLGGPQVATNILSGFPIGAFTAHLCN